MKCQCICHDLGDDRLTCQARGCCNAWAKGYRDGMDMQRGFPEAVRPCCLTKEGAPHLHGCAVGTTP